MKKFSSLTLGVIFAVDPGGWGTKAPNQVNSTTVPMSIFPSSMREVAQ